MKQIFIVIVALCAVKAAPNRVRIYGGQDAAPGQFPFIVTLNNPEQFCDGSIIDKQWIVTAAHCVVDLTISDESVVLVGTHIAHSGGKEYKIKNKIANKDFNPTTGQNDIGLIQLDGELEYSDMVQPIAFGDPDVNATCIAAGWGLTESDDWPKIVQFVELTAIDLELCKSMAEGLTDKYYLGPETVCTLASKGKGTCYGDSGGPLICDGKLSGILSYGVLPCGRGYPDVFTRPSSYADWIQEVIKENTIS